MFSKRNLGTIWFYKNQFSSIKNDFGPAYVWVYIKLKSQIQTRLFGRSSELQLLTIKS